MHKLLGEICDHGQPTALCVITRLDGATYRPLGAFMAVYGDGSHVGHVSSGCIESDIIEHCQHLTTPKIITYGRGSPFIDLRMPCGGGMDILIIPNPSLGFLNTVLSGLDQRTAQSLSIAFETGKLAQSDAKSTFATDTHLHIHIAPAIQFCVFGNSQEADVFTRFVIGAGYDVVDFTPQIDHRTAICLFFHDHDMEHDILQNALKTDAFYIGAQGSYRTHQTRLNALSLADDEAARIRGPIGLIPRVRDPQTLAISVLAEIHAVALDKLG